MDRAQRIRGRFRDRFEGDAAGVYRAPGRVNLIGEHTDYNDGFVLPAAIEFSCWVASSARDDRQLGDVLGEFSSERGSGFFDELIPPGSKTVEAYPIGVAWELEQSGIVVARRKPLYCGDVPLGAGLSSSAAIEVATG